MRMEELINYNYEKLNENDLLIWRFIKEHKAECCEISIEDLASQCHISRTTISRFTQKLSFDGFREFKVRLKLEYEQEQIHSEIMLDQVCTNLQKCIQITQDTDMDEICERIYTSNRLFVFGTGEVQNAAAQMIKRMFMNARQFFIPLFGKNEVTFATENLGKEDLVIIISLSGETELAVTAAKKLRSRGTYTISITRLSDNTLARLCDKSLYIMTDTLMNIGGASFETCSSYFNVVELLCVKYLMYLKKNHLPA